MPARRNFLKSDNVEFGHIQEEFLRVALVHTDIHFKLYHNDNIEYNLLPTKIKQRIVDIFGSSYKERLIPIEEQSDIIKISGFVSKPECSKKSKGEQYLFVNNRFIRHAYFHHAIISGYDSLIQEKTYPSYFIFLQVNPEQIDINIHPTKTEVKFREEQAIYKILYATVKHGLGVFNLHSNIDFENMSPIDMSGYKPLGSIREPLTSTNDNYNPFEAKYSQGGASSWTPRTSVKGWENIYESIKENTPEVSVASEFEEQLLPLEDVDSSGLAEMEPPSVFQVFDDYIVGKIKSGVVLIRISAALERIYYDRYLSQLESIEQSDVGCQKLLFADTITLSPQNSETMKDVLVEFNKLGFDIEEFGKNTFIINGVPADLSLQGSPQLFIEELLEIYNNNLLSLKISRRSNIAHSWARAVSGKRDTRSLSQEEMQHIINELFCSSAPQLSPSGKKACIVINEKELFRFFN